MNCITHSRAKPINAFVYFTRATSSSFFLGGSTGSEHEDEEEEDSKYHEEQIQQDVKRNPGQTFNTASDTSCHLCYQYTGIIDTIILSCH